MPICSLLHGETCNLDYFPFHNWPIKGYGMCCPVRGKVHIKDLLLLIGKNSLCGDCGFPRKKYVTITICLTLNNRWYENQCALEASLNKGNFTFHGETYSSSQYFPMETGQHVLGSLVEVLHPNNIQCHIKVCPNLWQCTHMITL